MVRGPRHTPVARSSQWGCPRMITEDQLLSNGTAPTEHTCEGTGGASVNTQTDRARRVLRCTRTPFGSAAGTSAEIGWALGSGVLRC